MTFISTLLIVISIILIFLSQDVNLRVRHRDRYLIDVDTTFLGFSIDTAEKRKSEDAEVGHKKKKKEKKKDKAPIRAYYLAISYLLFHSTASVGKLFPPRSGEDSVLTLFPSYAILYSLLSLVINKSEGTSLASDYSVADDNAPNIDVAFRFSLIILIISLLRLQYYIRKERKEYSNV